MPSNARNNRSGAPKWWQPSTLSGQVLSGLLAALGSTTLLALAHHIHLTWH